MSRSISLALALTLVASYAASAMETDWKQQAAERTERVRKGDFTLTLTDDAGRPLSGALQIRMKRLDFGLGVCVTGNPQSDKPDDQRYFRFIADHFNTIVHENDLKWYAIEREKDVVKFDRADAILQWADDHGIAARGHCLLWAKQKFVQPWLQELDADELRRRVDEHLQRTITRYTGRLIAWDVNNEMLDGSYYVERLGEGFHEQIFRRVSELDPTTPLFVNEYSILGVPTKLERYKQLIARIESAGGRVDGIGIQEHGCERILLDVDRSDPGTEIERQSHRTTPQAIWETLDDLKTLGKPIHLTEISAKHPDPIVRADALEALYRIGFAHESVELILLWGFWERRHWLGAEAALVSRDWELLEPGRRLLALFAEWRTDVDVVAADGRAAFRGFYGTYEITLTTPDGRSLRGTASLPRGTTNAKAVLR